MSKFRLTKKRISVIVSLLLLLVATVYEGLQPQSKQETQQNNITPTLRVATQSAELVKVTKVIDGDTIILETGQRVRYIGIDSPELHHPKKKVECFGKDALEKNRELIEGKYVKLEKDVSETDRYWRLLRYVYVDAPESTTSPLFVNEELVKQGFAYAATFPPDVKYAELFRELERQAREGERGLWKECK